MARCPHCGRESSDPEFCDHCNGEITIPSAVPSLPSSVTLADGRLLDCSAWQGCWPAEGTGSLSVENGGLRYRLHALGPAWWAQRQPRVAARAAVTSAVLAPVEVLPLADGAVVAAHALPPGSANGGEHLPQPLAQLFDERELRAFELIDLSGLCVACGYLEAAFAPLHEAGLVWLNFDPAEIEWADGWVQVTNLDLEVFRTGECPDSLHVSPRYSPPEVCSFRANRIGPATDVYQLSLYAYYWLAGLLPHGFPGKGLEAFRFEVPPLRTYRPHLPPGIAPVLERGVARDPARRFPTTGELLHGLCAAAERAKMRQESPVPVTVEMAGATRCGQAKAALGRPNQDDLRLLAFPAGDETQQVAVVADGVSHARVGSGGVASQTACEVLAETLPGALAGATLDQIEGVLTANCLEAAKAVVRRASAYRPPGGVVRDSDWMSTTVLIGVVRLGLLHLANVGDSRAYLIGERGAEQLTVDGDVAAALLAARTAPEEVSDMGPEAKALRYCLGVCREGPGGVPESVPERATPQVSRWRLQPGDVVLLCSDGLIEEGVFLEPGEVARLVNENPNAAGRDLAELLVATADARQRLPSLDEPEGFGDNITCVVLKAR
jgi:serine/threonine protein phosphatase PrpC